MSRGGANARAGAGASDLSAPNQQSPNPKHAMRNFFDAIADIANAQRAAVAFETPDGISLRFQDLLEHSARFAGALDELGVRPGDRVLVQVEKSLPVVPLYLAVLRLGAVYLPLNSGYTDNEVSYFIGDAGPRAALTESSRVESTGVLLGERGVALSMDDLERRATTARAFDGVIPRTGADAAAIVYTSGTTGRSKGAVLTHHNLESNARTLVSAWGFTRADVLVHALPVYHVHGLFVALHCALLSGARTVFLPRFDTTSVVHALSSATVFMGVPTYYTRLLNADGFPPRENRVRLYVSGSAPLRPETFAAFEARTGQRILERYGMSEAGMITSNPLHGERRAGAVGRPLSGIDVRVRGADGELAGADRPGVLEIRGPNVFAGYWRNPDKTAESFTADGWFVTGDVATIGPDGVVTIVGREKDLIISGGLNVYPKEIEDEIDALEGVRESAVIGVPHPDFGEAVVAVIDAAGATLDEGVCVNALRTRLAGFKVPKRFLFVDELPRNAMGKVQKKALRERFGGLFV